ncbi:MAG: tyrosine-protein phosphatase [Planctomycetes bacterium]|nr:tyrosine-protein phosphatase [Planctomycetota bacterium]
MSWFLGSPHGLSFGRFGAMRAVGAALGLVIVGALSLAWHVGVFTGNRHVVAADRVYRSAQLPPDELRAFLSEHGIRRVLNLRKATDPTPEYAEEQALCAELDVEFVGLPFSPTRLPEPELLVELIACFRRGPYPLLIHCEHGADRTGLASVVYGLVVERKDLDGALRDDLSWRTGHAGLGRERAMDRLFELFRDTRGERDFETWVREVYPELHQRLVHPPRKRDRAAPGSDPG